MLHIHPLTAEKTEKGDNITVISSEEVKDRDLRDDSRLASEGWHAELVILFMSSYRR